MSLFRPADPRRGAAAVEFALLVPLLIVLFVATAEIVIHIRTWFRLEHTAAEVANIFRRAFSKLKNGRGGPVIVEIPADMWNEEVPEPLNYTPVLRTRTGQSLERWVSPGLGSENGAVSMCRSA